LFRLFKQSGRKQKAMQKEIVARLPEYGRTGLLIHFLSVDGLRVPVPLGSTAISGCRCCLCYPIRCILTVMVRFTVLASGSRGNSTVVCGGQTRILVDAGLSCRELFRRMRLAGEEPERLDAIIVTHEHQDHINGLAVTARKLGIPVYFTEATHRAWMRWLTPRRHMTYAQWLERCQRQAAERRAETSAPADECDSEDAESFDESNGSGAAAVASGSDGPSLDSESAPGRWPTAAQEAAQPAKNYDPTWLPSVQYFQSGRPFFIGDIAVNPFTTSHDAADPVGFVFAAEGVRMAVATDLGYISPNVKVQLKGVDLLLLESNHDLEMLRDGPYPWAVKQRVLSRVGHLSNEAAADFLENGYDGQATFVILGHLSENNNLPELARMSAERALSGRASLLANRLLLARQQEPLTPLRF
jgi:phosphoribosyl 1,2-cyclic phosphodiesterase